MDTATSPAKDGRTVRAERTRQALVDALLGLLHEGELRPTAERIAERAGVSQRSVFQHFADREELYQAVAVQQFERIIPTLKPIDASLPLPERIEAFAEQRTRLLESITPVRRAALLLEPDSDVVSHWLAKARRSKAIEVERIFAGEIERMPKKERPAVAAALAAASAWTFWESLRAHQGLGVERARAAVKAALTALLAGQR
jgi:TetR/AcrR family transcriptional regulator of autoinduction and epiphytic fitness